MLSKLAEYRSSRPDPLLTMINGTVLGRFIWDRLNLFHQIASEFLQINTSIIDSIILVLINIDQLKANGCSEDNPYNIDKMKKLLEE